LRVDRDEVVVAFELDRVAVVIDEGDRIGSCGIHPGKEFAEQPPHVIRIDISAFHDFEPDAGEGFGNQSAISEGMLDRPFRISRIADHQRDPLLGRGGCDENEQQRHHCGEAHE